MILAFEYGPQVAPEDNQIWNALCIVRIVLQNYAAWEQVTKLSFQLGLKFAFHQCLLGIGRSEDKDAKLNASTCGSCNYTRLNSFAKRIKRDFYRNHTLLPSIIGHVYRATTG